MMLVELLDYTSSLEFIVLTAVLISTVVLATAVLISDRRSATNKTFFVLSMLTASWLAASYVVRIPETYHLQLFFHRISIFFAAPLSTSFFLFAYSVPHKSTGLNRKTLFWIFATTVIMMLLNISPYAFTGVAPGATLGTTNPTPGIGFIPFAILSTLFSVLAVYYLIKRIYSAQDEQLRSQLSLVLTGMLIMLSLITATVLVPILLLGNALFLPFLPLYALIFLGITAYAITKYKLFDLKILVTEMLTFILWVVLFAKIFSQRENVALLLTDVVIFVFAVIFGVLLIRSVIKEVEQREKIETLAEDLKRANARLKELDQLKSEFVSIASHQLRSPLTAIKGYTSLLLEGSFGKIPTGAREAIKNVFESSSLMAISVQEFLDVSRIEQGKMKYNYEIFDIKKLVKTVVEEQVPIAKKKKLSLVLDSEDGSECIVNADFGKMKQIITNLIDNSIKYTTKGSITVRVGRAADSHQSILISISDTGVGMSQETIVKLFGKFNRAKNANEVNVIGTGLGLYVVKNMIEAQGGEVWAESKGENMGSTFYIKIKPEPNKGTFD